MTLKVLSLGAGVQSTTLALMAAHGEFDCPPDAAVFADTGDEPEDVYRHLEWLQGQKLPFPIHITSRGVLSQDFLNGVAEAQPPLTVSKRSGRGMLQRQCTRNYKIYPVTRKIRELCGKGLRARMPANSAEVWIGISMDEIFRMRPSRVNYLTNRHPLIEKRMTRQDCLKWLEAHGYPRPPKSSCWHCPYQSVSQWRDKRDNQPGEWKKAVEFDKAIRNSMEGKLKNAPAFIHTSGVPLDEVDLSNAEDHGQMDMFNNECEGMCGV